jgi:TolB-like protein
MKKIVFSIIPLIMLFIGCAGNAKPAAVTEGMTLDQAITEATFRIEERIAAGTKIAPLNFNSTSDRFSSYVLDEITANLVETGKLIIVDRSEIDLIRSEFDFQYSGEVGDDSMQALGRMLGAQSIISGSLTDMGGFYRIVIRVLDVQTAAVAVQYRSDIANDSRVQALLEGGRSGGTATASAGTTASGGQTAQTPAQPATIANGTYTFFPRPRAHRGGIDQDAYIDRIVVRGGFMNIYLSNRPIGTISGPALTNEFLNPDRGHIQDLDRPQRTYNVVRSVSEPSVFNTDYIFISLNNQAKNDCCSNNFIFPS